MTHAVTALFLGLLFLLPLSAQEHEQKVEEYMDVINVEILARALKDGQPVGGLLKEDLTLYENGEPVEITSFFEVKRRMGIQNLKPDTQNTVKKKPRIFFLFFWISEPGTEYRKVLDHFFTHIYQKQDYVVLATQNDVFKMPPGTPVKNVRRQLADSIDRITLEISRFQKNMAAQMERECQRLRQLVLSLEITKDAATRAILMHDIMQVRTNIKLILEVDMNRFRYRYLKINTDRMISLARSIKNSVIEKWGIIMYQPMAFPMIDARNEYIKKAYSSDEPNLSVFSSLGKSQMAFKRVDNLTFLKKIRQAFFENNTPFHTIILNSTADIITTEEFLRKEYPASEWEETFRSISKVSGGDIVSGTKIIKSMNQITEKEDIYYILTYSPRLLKEGKKVRKLTLKTGRPGIKIFHHQRIDLSKIENISLESLSYTHPNVSFTLKNYRMRYQGDRFEGKVKVLYSVSGPKGESKTLSKDITITEQEISLTLDLHLKSKSRYTISVIAIDLNANKKSISTIKVTTPEPALKPFKFDIEEPRLTQEKLPVILSQTADYCEKLKKAAFHFYCQEKIMEAQMAKHYAAPIQQASTPNDFRSGRRDRHFIRSNMRWKKKYYIYDYQIILKNGKISESRTLIREKNKKVNIRNAPLKTRFSSEYSFYMPLIFARENQDMYRYTLLKEQRIKGIKTYKISVEPKSPEMGKVSHGLAWVSREDGSVVAIRVHPRSFIGAEKIRKAAMENGYDLMLTDEHLYLKERNGIRFPTQTTIHEGYISNISSKRRGFTNAYTRFTYTKYRFFNVDTEVTTHDPA